MKVLSSLSPKLDITLPAVLIANVITSILANHLTDLQVSLAVLLRESKELVKTMSNFGVTCTYEELLHFNKSVAAQAAKSADVTAVSKAEDDLIQVVVNNFDADIASQNCQLSTHSLAVLVTQPDAESQEANRSKATSMSEARLCGWTAHIGKPGMTCAPKLSSLPPTTQVFFENVKRAHFSRAD